MSEFNWRDLAFASKKDINQLRPIFIMAPRNISVKRFAGLVKQYLPKSNILLGISDEPYVVGLEDQPQFKMLEQKKVQLIIDKVDQSNSTHKIHVLHYSQRHITHVYEKLKFREVLLVNGSWHHAFHNLPAYYALASSQVPYKHVSPFVDEAEAKNYGSSVSRVIIQSFPEPAANLYSDTQMMQHAKDAARLSFDYNFQTGVSLGIKTGRKYTYLARSFNKVVPYQTHAMHYGASREVNFSPPHDLNYYDTVHAEVAMIVKAQKEKIDLKKTTLFINLLPCPACARMFVETDIKEFVYGADHSEGYAAKLLEESGKIVRRIVL